MPAHKLKPELSTTVENRTPAEGALSDAVAVMLDVIGNVNNLLSISKSDSDSSGEPGPQAEGVNHLETPLRQLQVTHRTSSCAKRGGHVKLCSNPWGARGIDPKTFRRRGFYHVLRPLDHRCRLTRERPLEGCPGVIACACGLRIKADATSATAEPLPVCAPCGPFACQPAQRTLKSC